MKRFLIVLALIFVLGLTACACGNDVETETPPADVSNGGGGGEIADPGEITETAAAGIHPARDMGGRVIRVGNYWAGYLSSYLFEEPNPAVTEDFEAAMLIWENAQRIRRDWNVEFEEVVFGYGEVVPMLTASAAAGTPSIDIMHMPGHMVFSAVTGNLIMPLGSIAAPTSDTLGAQIHSTPGVFFNDNYWSFNTHMYTASGVGVGVNMDLIRSLGLPDPVALYNSGEWNWDNFLYIMRRASDVPGHFGMAGNHGEFIWSLIAANDGMTVDENYNFGMAHPNTIEALEMVDLIFRERLWYYNPVIGAEIGDWGRNFWSFQDGNSVFWPAMTWSSGEIIFDYHIIPWPRGPANTSGGTWFQGWPGGLAIPVGVEDPEAVFMIMEELHAWPGPDGQWRHFQDSVNWPMGVFRHEDDVWRMLQDIGDSGRFDFGLMLRVGGTAYTDMMNDISIYLFNQYATPIEAVETHRGSRQAMLDQFLGR